LKAVLNKEYNLRQEKVLSHCGILEVKGFDRLFYVSDGAMNIDPDCEAKAAIIKNAVKMAHCLGNENPVVALLAAIEKLNPKMQPTVDAVELVKRQAEFEGCRLVGPLGLDNAVSVEAAKHKGIENELAGRADILIVPDIEAGNILYKSLVFMAGVESAGIIMGAKVPIVLTSRSDSAQAKVNSLALALTVGKNNG